MGQGGDQAETAAGIRVSAKRQRAQRSRQGQEGDGGQQGKVVHAVFFLEVAGPASQII
jgi:hypothetical protein